tara:strand:- start:4490 stop:4693 length:204 start_codon:yes stop_codon:yes gene_type:complete
MGPTEKEKIFKYVGWANTVDFAESLGFVEAKDWEDIDILDEVLELEADCILYIESKGYTVIGNPLKS